MLLPADASTSGTSSGWYLRALTALSNSTSDTLGAGRQALETVIPEVERLGVQNSGIAPMHHAYKNRGQYRICEDCNARKANGDRRSRLDLLGNPGIRHRPGVATAAPPRGGGGSCIQMGTLPDCHSARLDMETRLLLRSGFHRILLPGTGRCREMDALLGMVRLAVSHLVGWNLARRHFLRARCGDVALEGSARREQIRLRVLQSAPADRHLRPGAGTLSERPAILRRSRRRRTLVDSDPPRHGRDDGDARHRVHADRGRPPAARSRRENRRRCSRRGVDGCGVLFPGGNGLPHGRVDDPGVLPPGFRASAAFDA